MRTFTLLFSALVLGTTAMKAQTVATFETLTLATADTYYVNYSSPGADVGFNDGLAHFPCIFDTSFGFSFLSRGFVFSNKTDSVTSGFTNQYSAKAARGYGGSAKYAVSYGTQNNILLTGPAIGNPVNGFYLTNNTYAFNSMRDGDGFAKKFGGTTGNDPDWFKIVVRGYAGDTLKPDSVEFYLADYRFVHNDSDYIVRTWQWVNLLPLGNVDSLQLNLNSSDNGSFGMNTPAYFCIDNLVTDEANGVSVNTTLQPLVAKVYPNPAKDMLYIDVAANAGQDITITDMAGHVLNSFNSSASHIEVNTSSLPAGMYMLQLSGNGSVASLKFVKQ
jgi:hypothetical protein